MKIRSLKNYSSTVGCEVYDIDFNNEEEVLELGKIVAQHCIVYVDQNITTQKLDESMNKWGQPSIALIHDLIIEKKLTGRHWRDLYISVGRTGGQELSLMSKALSTISYKTNSKDKPVGMFTNGELDWHSDQCAFDDAPRIIGLQSVSDSNNSQTQFLCTHDVYENLSADTKSMIKELVCTHKWVPNLMAPDLNELQTLVMQYNMCPVNGLETNLYSESVTGLPGIKFPSHTFNGFVGMSMSESNRILSDLRKALYQDKYVYTQDWKDGEIVFMDQEITLHKRPTNVAHGSKRTMARVITYLDKLYPEKKLSDSVKINGKIYNREEFIKLVDDDRKETFDKENKLQAAA
jgi:alpha-ketoglutarate-dependent taurine dioxygenase